jgi:hypothetical protein
MLPNNFLLHLILFLPLLFEGHGPAYIAFLTGLAESDCIAVSLLNLGGYQSEWSGLLVLLAVLMDSQKLKL